jgi:hypothetical protein
VGSLTTSLASITPETWIGDCLNFGFLYHTVTLKVNDTHRKSLNLSRDLTTSEACWSGRYASELLAEIVISNLIPPLTCDAIDSSRRDILPLHCRGNYSEFHRQSVQLMLRFVAKGDSLLALTVSFLHRHWPTIDKSKQILFMNEYEEIMVTFESSDSCQCGTNDCSESAAASGIESNFGFDFLLFDHGNADGGKAALGHPGEGNGD